MKKTKGNKINIIFSSFLVIGYIVCAYFFSSLADQVSGTLGSLIRILILVVFGLLLFYATRVGEGKQIRRFSLAVLLLIDIPSLYIILASLVAAFPLHDLIAPANAMAMFGGADSPSIILMMACAALGYGIPYTFLSGYEIKEDEEPAADAVVEGGLAEELAETATEDEEKAGTSADDEAEKSGEDEKAEAEGAEAESEAAEEKTEEKEEE